MPLHIRRRHGRTSLEIYGTVRPAGEGQPISVRKRAGSDDPQLAAEEARLLEAEILRSQYHGKRRASATFAEAAHSYLTKAGPHSAQTKAIVRRLTMHFRDTMLDAIDQEAVDRARSVMLRDGDDASPATVMRSLITPLRAILTHAARRKWCDVPQLELPRVAPGRTAFLLPDQAEALIAAASPHIKPLLTYLVCTGCRLGEALRLRWPDVDLRGARAILWEGETKGGGRRVVQLPPRAIAALAVLPHRDGHVFRTPDGEPYRQSDGGGQIKQAWATACRDAGLPGERITIARVVRSTDTKQRRPRSDRKPTATLFKPEHHPHDLRHTWASWFYAVHKDLLLLQREGGWSDVKLVTRYAHIMREGHQDEIRAFWGLATTEQRRSIG